MILPAERLLAAIRVRFPGVKAGIRLPRYESPGAVFIRVDPAGATKSTPVSEETMFAVQVYGADLEEVLETMGDLRDFLDRDVYVGDPSILWWSEMTGPHDFPDPDVDDVERWQLTGVLSTFR